jgi:hypothetical protein
MGFVIYENFSESYKAQRGGTQQPEQGSLMGYLADRWLGIAVLASIRQAT